MAQNSQQFTPAQILEAGHRAEIEGRVEYAIQFYRHLIDHLPRSPEAMLARESLSKLGALPAGMEKPVAPPTNGTTPHNPYSNGSAGNSNFASQGPAINSNGPLPFAPYNPTAGTAIVPRRPQPVPPANPNAGPRLAFVMPKSKRRYRTGRFFARAFCLLGFLQIGVGTGAMIIGLLAHFGGGLAVMPAIIAAQPPLLAGASGMTLAFLGLMQVLVGQLARAIFDQASASRDIAAFNRARTAYDLGTPLAPTPES